MKRIIALALTLTMLTLSLCSCGKGEEGGKDSGKDVVTSPYAITFEDVKDGYIKHANKGLYSIEEEAGYQCTDDFYVFLPKYTVISSEKEFAVFCYDFEFVLETGIMKASGQEMDKMTPIMAAGTRTLSEDTYVRISVKGSLSDVTVSVPNSTKGSVSMGSKKGLINMPVIKETVGYFEGREQAVNYIFITDIHYSSSKAEAIKTQLEIATEMANTIDAIDFIVIGGDTTTGMFETKSAAIETTQLALEPLKECKKPVFVLMGNHDDNSYHRFTYNVYYPDRIISDKDWKDNVVDVFCPDDIVHDSQYKDSKYYYYDLADKKTRIICLDAVDYRAQYNSKGVISELPIKDPAKTEHVAKYWSGCSWWGYSDQQINWLVNEAMTADKDWDYVFLSHMGIDANTNCYNYVTQNGPALRDVIKAYQNRQSYGVGGKVKDYSGVSGKILAYQFGHIHTELTHFDHDVGLWQISTATANAGNNTTKSLQESSISNKKLDWNILNRTGDPINEYCFDIMSVDQSSVHKYGYGASTDEKMNY